MRQNIRFILLCNALSFWGNGKKEENNDPAQLNLDENGNVTIAKKVDGELGPTLILLNPSKADGTSSAIDFQSSQGAARIQSYGHDSCTDLGFLTQKNGSLQQRLQITSDGKVGIGTSDPACEFEICLAAVESAEKVVTYEYSENGGHVTDKQKLFKLRYDFGEDIKPGDKVVIDNQEKTVTKNYSPSNRDTELPALFLDSPLKNEINSETNFFLKKSLLQEVDLAS